jgi:hypothetical protein
MVEPYVKSLGTRPALSCCLIWGRTKLHQSLIRVQLGFISIENIGIFCLLEFFETFPTHLTIYLSMYLALDLSTYQHLK